MNHDINVKKMRLNCFRQSKVPGEFMLQMRVPGGMVDAKYLSYVEHIANTWGDGNFHFGTRQTFDITGIKYENIPAVNEYLEQYIKEVDAELCGVNMDTVAHEPQPWDPKAGYPTIGARNITACWATTTASAATATPSSWPGRSSPSSSPAITISKSTLPAAPTTATRPTCATSASSAWPA